MNLFRTFAAIAAICLSATPAFAQQVSAAEQQASALVQAGDWANAVTAYAALAAAEPANPRAAFWLGAARQETGRYAEAIAPLQQALALGFAPPNQVHVRLARAYARLGDSDRAFAELEGLVAKGFVNLPALQQPDFASLPADRFKKIVDGVNANLHPCANDPNYHAFDFWIGTWDVQQTGVPRAPAGATSIVERQLDGCVIQENWMPPQGPAGKSFNIYNRVEKRWEQHWVDATGTIVHYYGRFEADGALHYEADQFGTPNKLRMTFFDQGPDQVRQLGHVSTDGGKTWTVSFDLTYVRKK